MLITRALAACLCFVGLQADASTLAPTYVWESFDGRYSFEVPVSEGENFASLRTDLARLEGPLFEGLAEYASLLYRQPFLWVSEHGGILKFSVYEGGFKEDSTNLGHSCQQIVDVAGVTVF